ncbi:MAG: hypothetical protein QHC90_22590 [Shinella sp.]|nr:hypothetical protein [Shinella sp.]
MKTVLIIAAAFGLSASAAMADCAGHTTSASVDKKMTTASVSTDKQSGTEVAKNVKQDEPKSTE